MNEVEGGPDLTGDALGVELAQPVLGDVAGKVTQGSVLEIHNLSYVNDLYFKYLDNSCTHT